MYIKKVVLILCLGGLLGGCNTTKKNLKIAQTSYCIPPSPYIYDSTYLPIVDIQPILNGDSLFTKKYSQQDLLIANATGTLLLLQDLTHLIETETEDNLVYILFKKQQIFNRLLLASIEVASLAAELDCESERSKQLADYLDHINDTRVQRLTILSVVTGAVTAIATLGNNTTKGQIAVGITGSIVSAVFGGWAVISSRQTIMFKHTRNLLSDIWLENKISSYYPPFIWFILTGKEFTNTGSNSTIHNLKERWKEEDIINVSDKKKEELFFGTGGKYKADDLHARTNMINQLKAEVRSVNQNLQKLMLKLSA
jgi:hypothetical protein